MTPGLEIHVLKNLQVNGGRGQPLDIGSPTTRSLFAYLVLHRQQPVDRRRLAFLFWPRGTEAAARRNLRQYLHRIRRALEPVDPDGTLLQTDGHHIRFHPPDQWFLDAAAFEAACTPPRQDLPLAISTYRGDLLEEIYDDWVLPERARLARLFKACLLQLIDQQEAAGNLPEAVHLAERYLAAEPLLETAHVRLMRLYYWLGDRGRVKQQYETLTATLAAELSATPLPETEAAYRAMIDGEFGLAPPPQPAPAPAVAAETSRPAQFVGRTAELDWLDGAMVAAAQAQGGFAFIQGESGVGKTRLVEEWLAQYPGPVRLLQGRAFEFESMIPYATLAHALRMAAQADTIPWDLFRPPPPWLTALLPLLPDLPSHFPGHDLTAVRSPHHVIESLGNFLLTLCRQRPLVLFLDNLHWADGPTWNFLGYLAPRVQTLPLLMIGTARAEDMPAGRARLLRKLERQKLVQLVNLRRLTREETSVLVRALMGDVALEPVFLRRIYEETEGNPFFIIETVRAVREAGGDWTQSVPTDARGQRPFFAIPLRVQAVIESRLDKLGEDSRAALGVAAVIGREFSFQLLQEVSQFEAESLLNALDEWLARGLVRESRDGYDFTHEKLSQVAYDQLTRARRQWIHLRVATYLAASAPDANPAQLAHHYYLSSEPGRALPYLARAGQRALSVRSYAEAREFGLRAIGLLGHTPRPDATAQEERLDLNLQLAQAYAFSGALPRALQLLQETERLAEAAGDMGRLARILHRSAQVFWLQGSPATADDFARRTLRHAEELGADDLRFAALRMLGRVSIVRGHFDDAIAYLLRYIDLASAAPQPDLPAVYGYLGVAYARVGSWQRALNAAQLGLDLASQESLGAMHMVARMQLAFVYAELREWRAALDIAGPMREKWREEGMTPYAFMLRTVIGRCLAHLGGEDAASGVTEIEAALRWAAEVDYRVQGHLVQMYLAQSLFKVGRPAAALETAVVATRAAAEVGDRWAEAAGWRNQAEIRMRQPYPNWQDVETLLIQSMHQLRQIRARPELARTYLTLRRLYDRAGQAAWAVDCHFRATSIFEELGMDAELKEARGRPAGQRTGAVVIPDLVLQGPNRQP